MRIHLLENPAAGRGGARAVLAAVAEALRAEGHLVRSFSGHAPGDLARHVASLGPDDADRIVVAGGDGTLRAVVNAAPDPPPWPIGVLPLGTANLVARELGLPPGAAVADIVRAFLSAEPWPADLLEIRRDGTGLPPERAITTVGVGVDGEIVHAVERRRPQGTASGGYARWAGPTVHVLRGFAFHPLAVAVDAGPPTTAATVVVQNTHSYGGLFVLSPRARLDSGRLEVVTLRVRSHLALFRLVVAAWRGRFHRSPEVRIVSGRRVSIRAPQPVAVQADGDPAGFTDLQVVLRPAAVHLLHRRDADGRARP